MDGLLPSKRDFVPNPGDPDQEYAWKEFGELTLDEAKERFADDPLNRQEDFMFMGTKAFLFYFPVVVDHLRDPPGDDGEYDWQAWILAKAIDAQFFSWSKDESLLPLTSTVLELADFVRDHVHQFESWPEERPRIIQAWTELAERIESLQEANGNP
ncbi:hypothetical protein [Alienimonas chondri]|uniref:Uncharacterized protein n=1 Tax=Alienimonas chondri TaxID=2681879 RepID=A0ABX1V961_9PLAN|nr:hypothetical protein [Alienimonas chondri]NNJ24442.1 hypothetical protein [Alienimonas chondri]